MRPASIARLVFLRGRDADGRLRELCAGRAGMRPILGALALALTSRRGHEALGYRSVSDYARERLGVGGRTVAEWARVWRALAALPRLRAAVLDGEVSWGVARLVVAHATPATEAACLETVRGRTVRAVEAMLRVVREREGRAGCEDASEEHVSVRLAAPPRIAAKWALAVELARRVAGEALPVWQCAEAVAAEAIAAIGGVGIEAPRGRRASRSAVAESPEHGLRERAFPALRWRTLPGGPLPREIAALAEGLDVCSARALDRRLRTAVAFLQQVDFEIGRVLRQVVERGLHGELGFERFDRYAAERLDLAPRTAQRLVALARAEHRAPAVATAFRRGRVTAFQAHAMLRVADADRWLGRAREVTLRRLEDEIGLGGVGFVAPADVAALFLAMVRRVGLEALLDHAIATWVRVGRQFRDYADFDRDGWRCTVPGCTARRGLESHHIVFRSAGGPDEPWNRTTLCAFHHRRGVHLGRVWIRGRAPAGLVFAFGSERYRSGDRRISLSGS